MPRIPNSNDASSMWKMNDQYLARTGDEWPSMLTGIQCAFTRSSGAALDGIYAGETNGAGTNIGSGTPMANAWGFGSTSADYISWQVADSNGWPSTVYDLDWIMVPTPYGGQTFTGYMEIQIVTGNAFNSNIVYESTIPVTLNNASQSYQKVDLPSVGSTSGSPKGLTMNTDYSIGMSWNQSWPGYFGTYYDGSSVRSSNRHTITLSDGRTIYMAWFNLISNINSWDGRSSNGTLNNGYGQLYSFGLNIY